MAKRPSATRATYVVPHVRTTRRGAVYPVRGHRRGVSFEVVPSPHPVVEDVKLHRSGVDRGLDFRMAISPVSAYVPLPYRGETLPKGMAPRTVYVAEDYTPAQMKYYRKMPREISKRWAQILGHEALHLALERATTPKTALQLDVPYVKFKNKSRGDISRGV